METLGLNEQHQGIVKGYMKFAKYQRSQNLKFIEMLFQDVEMARLNESTFTKDEVQEILDNLKELVTGEVVAELIDFSHTNILLFAQLLTQAEKWHLHMTVDLSEIQNRELLDKVKIMEEADGKAQPNPHRLQPLTDQSGSTELLRMEISRLRDENLVLQSQLNNVEKQLKDMQDEKEQIKEMCTSKEEEVNVLKKKAEELTLSAQNIQTEITKSDSEQLLGEYEKVLTEQLSLELESMRQEYLSVQSQLTLAEQELERKFNQTTAYSNMKMMIAKKNDQVKELRNQLLKFQKPDEAQS
ncbi:leucine zipper transcription factor-like protein 1 isoform X2 [Cimex lectularius]|uniref:Leucine zipper transcription factor-like protein 1 n=1 Tax=Cimex lectularius TaxID=79782 RepID=A0A8I6RYR3_CIMLE|nr:leucine zipper transcription factor-like protein 1 isoform X2 [Cimex lectularius]